MNFQNAGLLHAAGNRRRAQAAQRQALDNMSEAAFAESRAEDAARQERQLEFGGNSLRMMLCGPQEMLKDMKGKSGGALTYEGCDETYEASDGDGCRVFTPWTTFESKPEDSLRGAILQLLQAQPALAGVTADEVDGLLAMDALQAFYVMDEQLFTFDCDGWAYTLPIRQKDKWVRLHGDECWCPLDQMDETMDTLRKHKGTHPETGEPLGFYLSKDHGGKNEDLEGIARLRVQLKAPLQDWAGDVEDFWPLTQKQWSSSTHTAIAAANAKMMEEAEAEAAAKPLLPEAAAEAAAKPKKSGCCSVS